MINKPSLSVLSVPLVSSLRFNIKDVVLSPHLDSFKLYKVIDKEDYCEMHNVKDKLLLLFPHTPAVMCVLEIPFGGCGGPSVPLAQAQTPTTTKFEDCDILTFLTESAVLRLSEIICSLFFLFVCLFLSLHPRPLLGVIVLSPRLKCGRSGLGCRRQEEVKWHRFIQNPAQKSHTAPNSPTQCYL